MAQNIWTIQAALDWTRGYLERKGDAHGRLSAEWLLGAATGLSRIELYTNYEQPLSLDERATLREYVSRRAGGEQHASRALHGFWEFKNRGRQCNHSHRRR